ncbi:MAG: hypothetical protein QM607_02975 [Microbacterium sp.]
MVSPRMMSVRTTASVQLSSLLRLSSPQTYAVAALLMLSNLLDATFTLNVMRNPEIAIGLTMLIALAGMLVVLPAPDPYPRIHSAIIVIVLLAGSFGSWNLPGADVRGWRTWTWGAVMIIACLLALRGRVLAAWIGYLQHVAIIVWWAVDQGRTVTDGLSFLLRNAGVLVVFTLFVLGFRRTLVTINRLAESARARALVQERERAEIDEQSERVAKLRALAGSSLELLASAAPLTDADRAEFVLAEATVRDWMRGGSIATDEVLAAARAARERGVRVMLLDDHGASDPDPGETARIVERALRHLAVASSGTVTIRRVPPGRGVAATIRSEDDHGNVFRDEVSSPSA